MIKKENIKYYNLAFLIILIILSYFIIKPFITALLISAVLAYLFYPLYKKLKNLTKNEVISSLITTIIIIIIILIPLALILNSIGKEAITLSKSSTAEKIKTQATKILADPTYGEITSQAVIATINYIKQKTTTAIAGLPSRILSLLISGFALFYFFIIGESLLASIKSILPLEKKEHLIKHIGDTTYAIVYGMLITAIIQFIIAATAFTILKIESALILAFIIGILGLIPMLGPIIVWLPLAIIIYLNGNPTQAIWIIITGIILSSSEHIIRAKIIGDKAKLHPITILLGVLGGLQLFGFIGLIIGPIILSSLFIIINEYLEVRKEK